MRVSGIILKIVHPTMLDLYTAMCLENPFLGWLARVTFLWLFLIWICLFMLRIPSAMGLELDCFDIGATIIKRAEQLVRPWVMTHLWGGCFIMYFYVLTGKNKAYQEVCVKMPPSPLGLLGLFIMVFGMQALLGAATKVSRDVTTPSISPWASAKLPGGSALWQGGFSVTVMLCAMIAFSKGPFRRTNVADYRDGNTLLEGMLPMITSKLKEKLPHSTGDCAARWAQKHPAGIERSSEAAIHQGCNGDRPLARLAQGGVNVTAKWIEGLDTLQIRELKITQPSSNVGRKIWNLTLSAEFTDLHIWLKVKLGQKVLANNYMCCTNPFKFAVRASAMCTDEHGFFSPVKVEVPELDPFDWSSAAQWRDQWGSNVKLTVDVGKKNSVQQQVRDMFTGQAGKMSLRLNDGTTVDPWVVFAKLLRTIVYQNSGSKCPHMPIDMSAQPIPISTTITTTTTLTWQKESPLSISDKGVKTVSEEGDSRERNLLSV
jgi:hypothetical protein